MVEQDHLVSVGEAVEIGPHGRVIEARAAMHDDQRGLLHHALAVDAKPRTHRVEEEARAVDVDVHGLSCPLRRGR